MRLFILLTFALCCAATSRAQDATFVVHKDTKVASISSEEAKNILLGNQISLRDGTTIKLAIQNDGPIHEKIVRDYTQRSTDQFEKYWKRLVFSGKGIMPTECKSDAEVIDFVAKTPGAFGYIAKASLAATVTAIDVK